MAATCNDIHFIISIIVSMREGINIFEEDFWAINDCRNYSFLVFR